MAKKTSGSGKSLKKERKALLERDEGLCGIHLEGCGQPISPHENWTVDHIVPRKIYKQLKLNQREYNRYWNKQPMHIECNGQRGIGYYRNWPTFACACHFLYFYNGHAYIYALEDVPPHGRIAWVAHQFIHGVVSPQRDHEMHTGIVLPDRYKTKTRRGYRYSSRDPQIGHQFPFIHPDQVMTLNAMALARVGALDAIAAWAGHRLKMLHSMSTTGGPRPEENFLIAPDLPGLGIPMMYLPLSIAIPRDALLNWVIPSPSTGDSESATLKPRNRMPQEATIIQWAGGAPPPTGTDEICDSIVSWLGAMGLAVQAVRVTEAPIFTDQVTTNVQKLHQWQRHMPDDSFGRLIPPLMSKKEQRIFSTQNIALGEAQP